MPGRRERYDEKLVRILGSACRIFAEKGYHHASVRDVAAATEVSPAGLYYYFRSKEELLFLILDHTLDSLLQGVTTAAGRTSDPTNRIRAIIREHLAFFREHPLEMRLLVKEWDALTGEFRQRVIRRQARYSAMVLRALRELRPEAPRLELRASAMALFGMVNWMHQWYKPKRNLSVEEIGEHFSGIFLRGFLSRQDAAGGELPVKQSGNATPQGLGRRGARSLLSGPGF